MHRNFTALVLGVLLVLGCGAPAALAQGGGEGTTAQRLEVMRSKLDSMRRSLGNAASSIKSEGKKDDKAKADDPAARLRGLEKEAGSVLSEVNDLRTKSDRAERVEAKDLERLETAVAELNTRAEAALRETAGARGATASTEKKKKKGKFLG